MSKYICRIEDLPTPTKKLTPELTPVVLFTGFEPTQVHQYIKVQFFFDLNTRKDPVVATFSVSKTVSHWF